MQRSHLIEMDKFSGCDDEEMERDGSMSISLSTVIDHVSGPVSTTCTAVAEEWWTENKYIEMDKWPSHKSMKSCQYYYYAGRGII